MVRVHTYMYTRVHIIHVCPKIYTDYRLSQMWGLIHVNFCAIHVMNLFVRTPTDDHKYTCLSKSLCKHVYTCVCIYTCILASFVNPGICSFVGYLCVSLNFYLGHVLHMSASSECHCNACLCVSLCYLTYMLLLSKFQYV